MYCLGSNEFGVHITFLNAIISKLIEVFNNNFNLVI